MSSNVGASSTMTPASTPRPPVNSRRHRSSRAVALGQQLLEQIRERPRDAGVRQLAALTELTAHHVAAAARYRCCELVRERRLADARKTADRHALAYTRVDHVIEQRQQLGAFAIAAVESMWKPQGRDQIVTAQLEPSRPGPSRPRGVPAAAVDEDPRPAPPLSDSGAPAPWPSTS